MLRLNRRTFLSGIATLSAGGIGYTLASQETQAQSDLQLQSFDIPDEDAEVVDAVSRARLNVTADYTIEAEKQPTRVILRLEGKRSGDYTQLAATELTGLESTMSGSKEMQGNLLDLPNLQAVDLSPSTQGETKTVDLSIKLTMTVVRDGATLSQNSVEDMMTINVTQGTASATIEIGGSGSVEIAET